MESVVCESCCCLRDRYGMVRKKEEKRSAESVTIFCMESQELIRAVLPGAGRTLVRIKQFCS